MAPLEITEEQKKSVPGDEVWSDGDFVVKKVDGDLIAIQDGTEHLIFDGDVEDENSTEPQDVVTGEFHGNGRWLVFDSADSLYLGEPWRLHVADRQHLDRPARTIGRYTGGVSNPGFAYPDLLDDQLIWTEPVSEDGYRIQHLRLDDGEPRTIAEGQVHAARFLDENTVAWQVSLAVEQHDLRTGITERVTNPLTELAAGDGQLAISDGYWVLANVPSDDSDSPTYDQWAWWAGLDKPIFLTSFEAPAYLSTSRPLDDGILGLTTSSNEPFVIDLRTGVAQQIHDGWAVVEPRDGVIDVELEGAERGTRVKATLPMTEVAQPGECVSEMKG